MLPAQHAPGAAASSSENCNETLDVVIPSQLPSWERNTRHKYTADAPFTQQSAFPRFMSLPPRTLGVVLSAAMRMPLPLATMSMHLELHARAPTAPPLPPTARAPLPPNCVPVERKRRGKCQRVREDGDDDDDDDDDDCEEEEEALAAETAAAADRAVENAQDGPLARCGAAPSLLRGGGGGGRQKGAGPQDTMSRVKVSCSVLYCKYCFTHTGIFVRSR